MWVQVGHWETGVDISTGHNMLSNHQMQLNFPSWAFKKTDNNNNFRAYMEFYDIFYDMGELRDH